MTQIFLSKIINTACTTACGDAPKEASSKRAIRMTVKLQSTFETQQEPITLAGFPGKFPEDIKM